MKKLYFLLLFFSVFSFSQQIDSLYAISTKTVLNPNTNQNTSSFVRVGRINPSIGLLSNIGSGVFFVTPGFALSGTSMNSNTNQITLTRPNLYTVLSTTNGSVVQQGQINNFVPGSNTTFLNNLYNNSDGNLYGLATVRVNNVFQGTYLSKLNTTNGNLTQISTNSITNQVSMVGSVIDPIQMIYYFSNGPKFIGLDIYNGSIYSNPDYVYSNSEFYGFANIAYSCTRNEIYGLIRGKIPGTNPLFPTNFIYYNRLGKINPTTGVVTEISSVNMPSQLYSVSAGSTIDEVNGVYYYADNQNIIGVSLFTGLVVSSSPISFQDGNVLHYLKSKNNCHNSTATRQNPALLSNQNFSKDADVSVYPNPVNSILFINTKSSIDKIEISDGNGRIVKSILNQKEINVEDFQSGIYFIKIYSENQIINKKFIKSPN